MTQDKFVIGDRVEYTGHACFGFKGKILLIDKNRIHIRADEDKCIYGFDFNPINIKKL